MAQTLQVALGVVLGELGVGPSASCLNVLLRRVGLQLAVTAMAGVEADGRRRGRSVQRDLSGSRPRPAPARRIARAACGFEELARPGRMIPGPGDLGGFARLGGAAGGV